MVLTWLCSFFWAGIVATQSRPYRYQHRLSFVLIFEDLEIAHMDGQPSFSDSITAHEARKIAKEKRYELATVGRLFPTYETANAVCPCNFSAILQPDPSMAAFKEHSAIGLAVPVASLRLLYVPESYVLPNMSSHSELEMSGDGSDTALIQWMDTAGNGNQPAMACGATTPTYAPGSIAVPSPETAVLGKPSQALQQGESTAAGPEIAELE